jgi:hypothetical protein
VLTKRDEQDQKQHKWNILRHLLGITKLDGERIQSVKEKLGVQNTVLEIQRYQRQGLQHVQRMGTDRYWNMGQRGIEALEAQGRDGRTSFTLRGKEQTLRLTLHSSWLLLLLLLLLWRRLNLHYIQRFIRYLIDSRVFFSQKYQSMNTVLGNGRCLLTNLTERIKTTCG